MHLGKLCHLTALLIVRVFVTFVGVKILLVIFVLLLFGRNYRIYIITPKKGHSDEVTRLDVGLLDSRPIKLGYAFCDIY